MVNRRKQNEKTNRETNELYKGYRESEETAVKDKKWLKDSIAKEMQELFSTIGPNYFDFEYTNKKIRGLVDQLDEPEVLSQELPVIPQWVADNIESKKIVGTRLNVAISEFPAYKLEEELGIGVYECNEIYARAWIGGYTVKKEQRYNVKFKLRGVWGTIGIFLYKKGNEVLAGNNFKAYYPKEDESRLTEQEIKDYDERFWAFAVPVEEVA